jgi:hypothetical protein
MGLLCCAVLWDVGCAMGCAACCAVLVACAAYPASAVDAPSVT